MIYTFEMFVENKLLTESKKTAKELYNKKFGKFDKEQFDKLMSCLPIDDKGNHKVKYADIIIKWFYNNNEIDLNDIKIVLGEYSSFESRTDSSNHLKLSNYTDFEKFKKDTEELRYKISLKTGSRDKVLYENEHWIAYLIKDKMQAIRLGNFTPWCITMDDSDYYEEYTENGNYNFIIILNKNALKEAKSVKQGFDDTNNTYYTKEMYNFAKSNKGTNYIEELDDKKTFSMFTMLVDNIDFSLKDNSGFTNWKNEELNKEDLVSDLPSDVLETIKNVYLGLFDINDDYRFSEEELDTELYLLEKQHKVMYDSYFGDCEYDSVNIIGFLTQKKKKKTEVGDLDKCINEGIYEIDFENLKENDNKLEIYKIYGGGEISNANFKDVVLDNLAIENSKLTKCKLKGCSLTRTDMYDCEVNGGFVDYGSSTNSYLKNVDWSYGTFNSGVWEDGEWFGGTWVSGEWKDTETHPNKR